jgi:hypothetical protein
MRITIIHIIHISHNQVTLILIYIMSENFQQDQALPDLSRPVGKTSGFNPGMRGR